MSDFRVYTLSQEANVGWAAMVKVTGAFQKSTEIMKTTNALVKLPQLSATMREMSMEMMKVSPMFSNSVAWTNGSFLTCNRRAESWKK